MHIIGQNQVGLIERLGKYQRSVKAGPVICIPFIDNVRRVSLALQPLKIDRYTIITKDNAEVKVSVTLNYKVTDPYKYFYENTDPEESMIQLVRGHLRDIIGRMDLNEALGSTKDINIELAEAIGDLTDVYGINVVRINIDELLPSHEIQESMDKQLRADRERIAAIAKAQGDAKSIELTTKAKNEATVASAKAEADATKLKADAEAYRIKTLNDILVKTNDRYLASQSLDSFNQLANGNNNLIVLGKDEISQLGNVSAASAIWHMKEDDINGNNNRTER